LTISTPKKWKIVESQVEKFEAEVKKEKIKIDKLRKM